jgi:murein DD-endopeptidase MepM/ murein hydrolase activator NlpD
MEDGPKGLVAVPLASPVACRLSPVACPLAPEPEEEPPPPLPLSPPLRNKNLFSPLPRGFLGGWGGDTGLDIAADHLPVYALAAGTLDYAEWGHTRWTTGKDTAFSIRIELDSPIPWGEQKITHVYYTHLSKVETEQKEGAEKRKHVVGGERIGVTGIGNGTPHLHLGLLLDNQVEQDSWTYILREGDIRKVMGGYKNKEQLPAIKSK